MAIDFSRLDTRAARTERPRYADDDRDRFRKRDGTPKKIHRGVVEIHLDERRYPWMGLDDVVFAAEAIRDDESREEIALHFAGMRSDDLSQGRVMADYQRADEARCDADSRAPIVRRLIVEGAWQPRRWTDRHGAEHKSWELLVARWSYSPDGETGFVEEGALPDHG